MSEESIANLIDMWGEDPQNPDFLHPDLLPYYEETGPLGSPMLRHPLVYQVPFFYSWKMANKAYELRLEYITEKIKEKRWGAALWMYEKPYRLSFLILWYRWKWITTEEMADILTDAWMTAEFPKQCGYRAILHLFKKAGYRTDAPDHHPPDEAVIYRGCQPKHKKGLSWTFNPRKAGWFATRLGKKNGHVYRARITKEGVLGIFLGKNEDEVVVDPSKLYDFEVFATPAMLKKDVYLRPD